MAMKIENRQETHMEFSIKSNALHLFSELISISVDFSGRCVMFIWKYTLSYDTFDVIESHYSKQAVQKEERESKTFKSK